MSAVSIYKQDLIDVDGVLIPISQLAHLTDWTRFQKWNDLMKRNSEAVPPFMMGFLDNERDEVIKTLRELTEIKKRFWYLFGLPKNSIPT